MAYYNTFIVIDCKKRKTLLVTSSARKANAEFHKGRKIEVWTNNILFETIRSTDLKKEVFPMLPYIQKEKEYIQSKQHNAEVRNARRKSKK